MPRRWSERAGRDSDQTATGPRRLAELVRVGMQFGSLTVIRGGVRLHRKTAVEVRCACGTRKRVRVEALLAHQVTSCGCVRAAQLAEWKLLRDDDEHYVAQQRRAREGRAPW